MDGFSFSFMAFQDGDNNSAEMKLLEIGGEVHIQG